MRQAYFDCFSGISGDMTLGALVDAGCPVEHLRSELRGLQVPGWELSAEKVWKQGSKDIRDVISLGKLIRKGDGPEEIEGLVKTLAKYTDVN